MSAPGSLKLRNPRFRVLFGNPDDQDSLTSHDVQTIGSDFQRVEAYYAQHRLGPVTDQPILATALSAYFALTRTGQIDETWESFQDRYLEIQTVSEDVVSPTVPDPGSG